MSQPCPDSITLWNNLNRVRWIEKKNEATNITIKASVIVAKYGKISQLTCIKGNVAKVEFYHHNRN